MSELIAPHEEPRHTWDPWQGPLKIPTTRAEVMATFGDPRPAGSGIVKTAADPVWTGRNIITRHGSNAFPGVPGHWYVEVHKLAEPYFQEAFRRASITCPGYIKRVGGFVYRHIRHDASKGLSLHSWGCAVDVNPDDNAGWSIAHPPEPWSDEWMAKYPRGVSREFVEAFTSAGFTWGGRWSGYCDPMHFQLARCG